MYERSAIVLERYLEKLFGFYEEMNLKENFNEYKEIVEETKKYQEIVMEEENWIEKFDEIAKKIQSIQNKQLKLCKSNQEFENLRNQLFRDLTENPNELENKIVKIEKAVDKNNEQLKNLSKEFIESLTIFLERQKERNKCTRRKRTAEANYINYIKEAQNIFEQINEKYVKNTMAFLESNKQKIFEEINQIMIKNGKNEKIGFHQEVIKKAITTRINIAQREAECYLTIYEKTKKLLEEIENEDVRINKYEKLLRDNSLKLAFMEAEKEYIVAFLDNERLTVINGPKQHNQMMNDACIGFEKDINQINNLYELLLREIAGKATKKAYTDLYNKTYLKNIEEKEKRFEKEVNHVKIQMGTLINSNYWRIEGIKNIYTIFQKEIEEKFEKDLSDFQIEEIEEFEEETEEIIDIQELISEEDEPEEIKQEEVKTVMPKSSKKSTKTKKVKVEESKTAKKELKEEKQVKEVKKVKKEPKLQEIKEVYDWENEIDELPKAFKQPKKEIKNDRVDAIIKNTRKRQAQELKKIEESNKGILNKIFKK